MIWSSLWVGEAYFEEICAESVPILPEEAPRVVENDPCEVVDAERRVDVGFGVQVVSVLAVGLVQLGQHRLVGSLFGKKKGKTQENLKF